MIASMKRWQQVGVAGLSTRGQYQEEEEDSDEESAEEDDGGDDEKGGEEILAAKMSKLRTSDSS